MHPTALGPPTGPVLVLVLGVAVGTALLLAVVAALVAGRRRLERELLSCRVELAEVRERLDALAGAASAASGPPAATGVRSELVITSLSGPPGPGGTQELAAPVSGRFASVALTESVVRLASLTSGLRRALSPASRNRIRFEMGREVKRARRQRRRDLKEAKRRLRGSRDLGPSVSRVEDAA